MTCDFIYLDDLSGGITASDLARSVIVVGHRRLSIPLDVGRYTDLTASLNPETGSLEEPPEIRVVSVTDRQGGSRPPLCLAINTDGNHIKLALHGLSSSNVTVYASPCPVQPIRSDHTTPSRDNVDSQPEGSCSRPPRSLADHSLRAIQWVRQFTGVVLPLAEIAVLVVAVALLIIGEIGVDSLLGQLR